MLAEDKPRTVETLIQLHREDILQIARKHGAKNVRLFGSVVRGESTAGSDIDLLVDADQLTSPWFPVGLVEELETLLGRRVDVVTEDALHWLLRRRILREARPL